nr:CDP-alcohol phosphatidyltransferase family protein [uncultured Anaerostipes sp.]
MKYTPKFFYDTMPEWKRKKDPLIARIIHRPISFVFSSLFVEVGLTPNQVSFLSLIIAFFAVVFFASTDVTMLLIGYLLLNMWSITDSADGNMARSLGGKPYGDFIDATSSYFLYGMMFLPLSYSVYKSGGVVMGAGVSEIMILGALAGSLDTMTRLFFQKMKNNAYEIRMTEMQKDIETKEDITDRSQSRVGKIQAKIDGEVACGGTVQLVLLLVCILVHALDLYVMTYFLYSFLTFVASVVYLIKKTGCLKN